MLVFDIGKTAFSICPEVENGYIKSIIAVNDEIWVGTNGSGIRIISASTGKRVVGYRAYFECGCYLF